MAMIQVIRYPSEMRGRKMQTARLLIKAKCSCYHQFGDNGTPLHVATRVRPHLFEKLTNSVLLLFYQCIDYIHIEDPSF